MATSTIQPSDVRVRLGPTLHRGIKELARRNERTLSAEIRIAVRAYVARELINSRAVASDLRVAKR